MQTVQVVARDGFPYGGINRTKGEVFAATVEDARILTAIGKVDAAPPLGLDCPQATGHDGVEGLLDPGVTVDTPATPRRRQRARETRIEPA
jgi:hypothetical protein